MKSLLISLLYFTGLLRLIQLLLNLLSKEPIVIILMYHRVSASRTPNEGYFEFEIGITDSDFEKQITYLKKRYRMVDYDYTVNHIRNGGKIPKVSVVLTFDDGYRDNYLFAYPVLKRHGLPARIFLATGFIDTFEEPWWDQIYRFFRTNSDKTILKAMLAGAPNDTITNLLNKSMFSLNLSEAVQSLIEEIKRLPDITRTEFLALLSASLPPRTDRPFLSWKEIQEMSPNKITFGAHTETHRFFPGNDLNEADWELKTSQRKIQRKLNQICNSFVYPFALDEERYQIAKSILQENDFISACSEQRGINTNGVDPFRLKRISAAGLDIPNLAYAIVSQQGKHFLSKLFHE